MTGQSMQVEWCLYGSGTIAAFVRKAVSILRHSFQGDADHYCCHLLLLDCAGWEVSFF